MRYIKAIILVVILLILDQFTKYLAIINLKGKPDFTAIKNVLYFSYTENRGAAFGILQNSLVFFAIVAAAVVVAIIIIYYKYAKTNKYKPLRIILLFIASGAVGNLIDRVIRNYVVDFIYFKPINFPVFNVADIYVSLGAAALVIYVLFFMKDTKKDR